MLNQIRNKKTLINKHLYHISYKLKKQLVKIWYKPIAKIEPKLKKSVAEILKEHFDAGHF